MLRFFVRLACVVTIASLPLPLHALQPALTRATGWTADRWRDSWVKRMGPEQTDRQTRTFQVGPSGALDVSNASGDIRIVEGGGGTITVEAVKRARATDARESFANTEVTMTERAGRVEVRTSYRGRNKHASVDYTVTAPAGTRVFARSMSGDVTVIGIRGSVEAESLSGNVVAKGTPLLRRAKSMSGSVTVSDVSSQDVLTASSMSGEITVRSVKARQLEVDSLSGEISCLDVTVDSATVGSISGGIEYRGPLARGGRYELKTHSGDIRLALIGTTGFELDARTFSGTVRSDVPITIKPGTRSSRQRSLQGVHGDGSAQVLLSSFSGTSVIVRQ